MKVYEVVLTIKGNYTPYDKRGYSRDESILLGSTSLDVVTVGVKGRMARNCYDYLKYNNEETIELKSITEYGAVKTITKE